MHRVFGNYCPIPLCSQVIILIVFQSLEMGIYCTSLHFDLYSITKLCLVYNDVNYHNLRIGQLPKQPVAY